MYISCGVKPTSSPISTLVLMKDEPQHIIVKMAPRWPANFKIAVRLFFWLVINKRFWSAAGRVVFKPISRRRKGVPAHLAAKLVKNLPTAKNFLRGGRKIADK